MLTLRPDQLTAIADEIATQQNKTLAEAIYLELCSQASDLMKAYDKSASVGIILETIHQCRSFGIIDDDQILNICLIRFSTDADILAMDAFSYVLKNDLMHPYAKARHMILSFFAVTNMTRGI